MAIVAGVRSTLNPNAPLFIPSSFRQVEDFSPKWWELVKTSSWFRDYWLSQHPEDSFTADDDEEGGDIVDLMSSFDLGLEEEFFDNENEFVESAPDFGVLEKEESGSGHGSSEEENRSNGLEIDAKALSRSLRVPESPKERSPKSPARSPRHVEKPAKHVSPKCTPRRIHQPR